ncbi:basic secretory protein-like protein [Pseudoalteromonas fenneropenaei]|uniref:Basic secretory protein-like protein n=1 Tax=Pseudoalteromonas fenneropenaei TaxID=1737459 RepID=A0ABV7CJ08_9GAMM
MAHLKLSSLLVAGALIAPAAVASTFDTGLKPLEFDAVASWQHFVLPKITLVTDTQAQSTLWQALTEQQVQTIALRVARILYQDSDQAPQLPTLSLTLKEMKGVAYKDGNFSGAAIYVSREYLDKFQQQHGAAAAFQELIGILYHEIAHAYQLDDHNYKEIGPIIEGIADVVRYKAGYIPQSARKLGGNYDSGYKTTAFYLLWLEQNGYPNMLTQINASLNPHDGQKWSWSWFATTTGLDFASSWQTYQAELSKELAQELPQEVTRELSKAQGAAL